MDRFFLPSAQWTDESLRLEGEEGHHALRVMRKRAGDVIEIFDGQGRWARGEIISAERNSLALAVAEEGESQPMVPQLALAVAIPKGKTMDLIVQKAVELGINCIQPLTTRNTVVKVADSEREEKSRKWQRVALEACKQCGQNFLPTVEPVKTLEDYLSNPPTGSRILASLAPGALPFRERLEALPKDCGELSFLVGPEGDFSGAEIEAALVSDFDPVSLGEIVLRVETACLFLVSAARYRFGTSGESC